MSEARRTVNVPVAADGTCFGPHMERPNGFQVGDKGDERWFPSFEQTLSFLKAQPRGRWRRRNSKGNWGIVVEVRRADIEFADPENH